MKRPLQIIPDEALMSKIYYIREQKVMLDKDLALLYDVETRVLKQAVRRRIGRFPDDFMFELSAEEHQAIRPGQGLSSRGKHSKYLPFAFTEHGILMLSSVLNSERAIKVNIQIVRVYTKMKSMLMTHKDLMVKMYELESKVAHQDKSIRQVFAYLKQFITEKKEPRDPIGFKQQRN